MIIYDFQTWTLVYLGIDISRVLWQACSIYFLWQLSKMNLFLTLTLQFMTFMLHFSVRYCYLANAVIERKRKKKKTTKESEVERRKGWGVRGLEVIYILNSEFQFQENPKYWKLLPKLAYKQRYSNKITYVAINIYSQELCIYAKNQNYVNLETS